MKKVQEPAERIFSCRFLRCRDFSLISESTFVAVAMVFLVGKIFAGTAAVTKLLFVTGSTGTAFACITVIGEGAGVGILALVVAAHKITLLFLIIERLDGGFKMKKGDDEETAQDRVQHVAWRDRSGA